MLTLDLEQLTIFGLLLASIHWLVARAEITRWFWSRVPGPIDALLRCPACSGFWLGAGLSPIVHPISGSAWPQHLVLSCLLGTFVTPVFEAVMLWGLERSAVQETTTDDEEVTPAARPPL